MFSMFVFLLAGRRVSAIELFDAGETWKVFVHKRVRHERHNIYRLVLGLVMGRGER